jgi:hypothetical protein
MQHGQYSLIGPNISRPYLGRDSLATHQKHPFIARFYTITLIQIKSDGLWMHEMHTTNSIQGNNFNVIKQEEPVIRKAILSNIDNAIFIAKGSVKSAIPVNVNAKIINQLSNNRVDTTQGIEMTKKLIATELINAINTIATNSNVPFHLLQQPTKVAVDNQAICTGVASASKAACSFTINIHN